MFPAYASIGPCAPNDKALEIHGAAFANAYRKLDTCPREWTARRTGAQDDLGRRVSSKPRIRLYTWARVKSRLRAACVTFQSTDSSARSTKLAWNRRVSS